MFLQTLSEQLADLRKEQQALLAATSSLVEATVSHAAESMPASLRDQLLSLSDRQFELARRTEQIVARLDAASTDADTADAVRLSHARQTAWQTGLTNQMRRAAEELSRSRVGNAAQQQREIDRILQQLLDHLHGDSPLPGADQHTGSASDDEAANRGLNVDLVRQQLQALLLKQEEIEQVTVQLDRRNQQQPAGVRRVEDTEALAEQQAQLCETTLSLSEDAASLQVLSWALKQVAAEMRRAADLLRQYDVGLATQESQQVARTQLSRLLQIWQTDTRAKPATSESPESPDQNPPPSTDPSGDALSLPSSEIRLLLLLQQDLNQRTRQLASRRSSDQEPDEHMTQQLGELARQQGQLAELLVQLLSAPQAEAETPSR